jgi:hypothetical protein
MRLNAIDLEGLSTAQRIKKFDDAHGDFVVVDNQILYEDGAQRDLNPYGVLCEPPLDDKECIKRIIKFREARMNLAREQFQVFKNNLAMQCSIATKQGNCNNPPQPPSAEAVARLKEIRKKVLHWQGKLTAARKKLEETIPENIKQRNDYCEQNRQKATDVMLEIESIEI